MKEVPSGMIRIFTRRSKINPMADIDVLVSQRTPRWAFVIGPNGSVLTIIQANADLTQLRPPEEVLHRDGGDAKILEFYSAVGSFHMGQCDF